MFGIRDHLEIVFQAQLIQLFPKRTIPLARLIISTIEHEDGGVVLERCVISDPCAYISGTSTYSPPKKMTQFLMRPHFDSLTLVT